MVDMRGKIMGEREEVTNIRKPLHDLFARRCMEEAPNTHVSWFIMASYAYYYYCQSIISDGLYDEIALWLKEHFDELDHPHVGLLTQDMFDIGSAFTIREKDYPLIVKCATLRLIYQLYPNGRVE